jgi:hypothetical protein
MSLEEDFALRSANFHLKQNIEENRLKLIIIFIKGKWNYT